MSFEKTFCPSPWFHMMIDNSGHYKYCRWASRTTLESQPRSSSIIQWFQDGTKDIRRSMLHGQILPGCQKCHDMEKHGKVSGRLRQLIKIGVDPDNFDKSFVSTPWIDQFKKTLANNGVTDQWPQDWQINLGNYCNSACLFCEPEYSSRLASEFKKIGLIDRLPADNWSTDSEKFNEFVKVLAQSPKLSYLHFIGGETLITPAFKKILAALVNQGLSKNIIIGFTTNLTTWDQSVVDLLSEFHEVNLGMSIECIHALNDYLRYGGNINDSLKILNQWLDLAEKLKWLVQLRITPTVFSIWHLDTVYEYAFQHQLSIESCNFLDHPADMRPSVLPVGLREIVIEKLQSWVLKCEQITMSRAVINTRARDTARQQIVEDARSYIHYLKTQPDESHRLPDLVRYIKLMEKNRGNSILDYLPEYETILRSAGY
jgi:sulfatase maturation enzyme AslB (radical SAM superfamily)